MRLSLPAFAASSGHTGHWLRCGSTGRGVGVPGMRTHLSPTSGPVRKPPWEPGAEEGTWWHLENTEAAGTALGGDGGSMRTMLVRREAIPTGLRGRVVVENVRG